jgi:hypothetical protein
VEFLGLFDRVKRHINDRFDLRGSDLATLIVTIFQNGGILSNNRRKRYADRVQAHVLDAVESAVARAMLGELLDDAEQGLITSRPSPRPRAWTACSSARPTSRPA